MRFVSVYGVGYFKRNYLIFFPRPEPVFGGEVEVSGLSIFKVLGEMVSRCAADATAMIS